MALKILDTDYKGTLDFSEYPFRLSDFQKHSIDSYHNGENVFIAAPTGSGKTLPAEHAIKDIVRKGKKAIYTSPIKTLSNQKFEEFTKKFPEADVGILTGDIKYNPSGNILIMTTEILRNLLFNKTIQDIQNKIEINIDIYNDFSLVIFDEIHYINDKDRGAVWEQSIVLLPSSIQIIMLSATINNPQEFCDWIRNIKNKDISLCSTNHRVVPLRHAIYTHFLESFMKKTNDFHNFDKFNNSLTIFSDENNKFNSNKYQSVLTQIKNSKSALSRNQVYVELSDYLKINKLVPCIFFCFSRTRCEKIASSLPNNMLDKTESVKTEKLINHLIRKCDNYESYVNMDQFENLKKCLMKGIAFHHSGLLPVFKEIVELLYVNNLVKILFATETFAVGVNMPTKTVVFTSLEKYSDNTFRYLHTHEYLQMGGRAGRRGLDKQGLVILLPNVHDLPSQNQMYNLICGNSQTIQSKFTPNYQLVLKMIINNSSVDNIINNSLLNKEVLKEKSFIEDEISKIDIPTRDFSDYIKYEELTNKDSKGIIKFSKSMIKKNRELANEISQKDGFENGYKEYLKFKDSIIQKDSLKSRLEGSSCYIKNQILKSIEILYENSYITKNKFPIDKTDITIKGIVASEINECNEIILTELIYSNLLDKIDFRELGAVLSLFGDSKPIDNKDAEGDIKTNTYKKYIDFVYDVCDYYDNYESSLELFNNQNWNINTYITYATYNWLDGHDFESITKEFSIFEGNLIKDFLKIYNLSAEVEKIAGILNKTNLQIEAAKVREHILRDVVNIESLYIKK